MPNRLADETSPYLLQHRDNPVDWYPWGEEALSRAKAEGRPILLSVGYSACHWCHVMERESFEDAGTAARMNRDFINVKVDREERPDLDAIYMQAVQAFTGGRGGWPMTVFLKPTGEAFFGGTYFPPRPSRGMPSFSQVMDHVVAVWTRQRGEVDRVAGEVLSRVRAYDKLPQEADSLSDQWLEAVAAAAEEDFDPRDAGFGKAPKFPPHGTLSVLLAHHHRTGNARSLEMVVRTLDAMAQGGMYDLLGGGFSRYSVDAQWAVPHFEKMLYDNALLVPVYVDAFRVTGLDRYARIVRETIGWALREMRVPGGGFTSAQDADSEGVEGKFFAWTPEQVVAVLGTEDGVEVCRLLAVTQHGTFEHGSSVLRRERRLDELGEAERDVLARSLPRLFEAREQRIKPGPDDKVLTAWNGLMISALARAGAALGEPEWIQAAEDAADFVDRELQQDGRLLRAWAAGSAKYSAYLDDYAFLLGGRVELWEATGEVRHLERAIELADALGALFWDQDDGGFFYTGHDAEVLVARSKQLFGGALPSGNGAAALALSRLAALTGREHYGEQADRILRSYQLLLDRAGRALGVEALAGALRSGQTQEVAVIGAGEGREALLSTLHGRYLPFAVRAAPTGDAPVDLLPWLEGKGPRDGQATGYVCRGFACLAPTTDAAEFSGQLDEAVKIEGK